MHREGNFHLLCSASARTQPGTALCRTGTETAGWWHCADPLEARRPGQGPGRGPLLGGPGSTSHPRNHSCCSLGSLPLRPSTPHTCPRAARPWPVTRSNPSCLASPPLPSPPAVPDPSFLPWRVSSMGSGLSPHCVTALLPRGPVCHWNWAPPVSRTRGKAGRTHRHDPFLWVTQGGRLGGYQPFPTDLERSRGRGKAFVQAHTRVGQGQGRLSLGPGAQNKDWCLFRSRPQSQLRPGATCAVSRPSSTPPPRRMPTACL